MIAFNLTEEQSKLIKEWQHELLKDNANIGAIGGRFTYTFTPTGIGIIEVVKDAVTGKELDITEYDLW